ncbi:MAG: polysaccharide deacetylase family protein, partial [Actinomycetota bacterium]|nr:polysaccharide deacetylase family protein [Actinomycetota bacterium]
MSATRAAPGGGARLRQMVAGLVALPLSAVPFVGYATLTPEGRLVRDRAMVAISPPSLPRLTEAQKAAAAARAPRYQGGVMALAYHGIGSGSDAEGGFVVSPKRFGEHLATLRAAGMRAVTAAEVATAFTGGRPLPPRAVMISFDDGRTDAMLFADPLLAQARMSATMFVIAGAASRPGVYYAPWDRIETYARSGRWDIQSHTASSHREQEAGGGATLPALTSRAPGESLSAYRARVRADLARASSAIEDHVGRPPVAFAYPFGAYGADRSNDPAIRDVLREEVARHHAVAFHQDEQESVPLLTADQDRLGLRRLEVGNWSGLELLERIAGAARAATPAWPGPEAPAEPAP